MIICEQPENFAVFCKHCGTYEIEMYTIDDNYYFFCPKCDIEERL